MLALQGTSYACDHHGQDNGRDIARRATGESASDILSKAIEALGGQDALESMKSVQSHASYVFIKKHVDATTNEEAGSSARSA